MKQTKTNRYENLPQGIWQVDFYAPPGGGNEDDDPPPPPPPDHGGN